MRLLLDHHYPKAVTTGLRGRGLDVGDTDERNWGRQSDESLLLLCQGEGRALVTNNARHFVPIAIRWADEGRAHSGLIFTSDKSLPRTREMADRFVSLQSELMARHPSDDSFTNRVHWL